MEEKKPQNNEIEEVVRELLDKKDWTLLKTVLIDLHPADIAELITRAEKEERQKILSLIETETVAEVIIELDGSVQKEVLEELNEKDMVAIIKAMDSDDATDIIGELEEDLAARVLDAMPWKESREVETLLRHDEETAGGIMALEFVAVDQNKTAAEAQEVLRRKADEVDDVYNIYVVDSNRVLKGVVSLKDMVLAPPDVKLDVIMEKPDVTVPIGMDREEVAGLFHKYDLISAPVIDENGCLAGRITVDDILDVVEEEVSKDITLMAGITDEEIIEKSVLKISSVRLPWLLVAFFGEMISAYILHRFQVSLGQIVAAAFFIPLIMAMGGNTGIQSSTIVIRGLATGEISLRDTGQRLLKEIAVAVLNGFIIAILLLTVVTLWLHDPKFGMILGIALIMVLFNAALMGTLVPLLLKRVGVDPAIATGPFITTSNDVLGLVVYFSLVTLFLKVY